MLVVVGKFWWMLVDVGRSWLCLSMLVDGCLWLNLVNVG